MKLDLPVDHRSVREARNFVATIGGIAADRLADAQLITSELVTNALLHAGLGPADRILLTLSCHGTRLRVDVDDAGSFCADAETLPALTADTRSRGLRIVGALAAHWQAEGGRVSAWIEL